MIDSLLKYSDIYSEWQKSGKTAESARVLTLKQVNAFQKIVDDDNSWDYLLSVCTKGRNIDAWLALDWPDGFDELVLCLPLCKLVDYDCPKCIIGKRQNNISCAHDYSVFGWIAELIKEGKREVLKTHLQNIIKLLQPDSPFKWDVEKKQLV